MLDHIVKRGVAHLQSVSPEYMAKLRQDAQLYETSGLEMKISPHEFIPVLITGVTVLLILASIRYTLGNVVTTLAIIESPSAIAIVGEKLPAYADNEELLIPAETNADAEITFVNRKPITASMCATVRHLRSIGGPFADWRGLGTNILYTLLHGAITTLLGRNLLVTLFASVLLSPVHMLWTHSMIAYPTDKSIRQRLLPFKQCIPLFLPSLVVTVAQQATCFLPEVVASFLDVPSIPEHAATAVERDDSVALALMALRILAVPITAALVAFFLVLPASAALTRIEASLLPEDTLPIVSFDASFTASPSGEALTGLKLFAAAWRSFDRAARIRVLKVYAKTVFAQVVVAVLGMTVMAAEVVVIGGERLVVCYTSARAQFELMMIEGQGGVIGN